MGKFKVLIKPTSGGDKISVDVEDSMTVAELKEAVAASSSIPAAEQRLIYRGQVLKDERIIESYGIKVEHVLHMVRSKPPAPENSNDGTQPSGQDTAQAPPLFGVGAQPPSSGQQQMLSSLLNAPHVQSILQNPDTLRSMLNSNPAIRQLMSSNPEMAHILNNPQLLRESLNLAANPSLLREQMRHSDRAMSNLEAHPEGFNALRRMYENIHEPLQNAARGENVSSANPFASLLQPPQGQAGAAAAGAAATSEAPAASATPNTAPLPNPWAPNAGSDSSVATSTALPAAGLPADLGGLGAMGVLPPGLGAMGAGDTPQTREAVLQMLSDPSYRQAMSEFMTSDFGQQAVRNMVDTHPQLQQMLEQNPMMRDVFNDPERMRRMLSPESLQAMMGFRQSMEQLQRAFGDNQAGLAGNVSAGQAPGLAGPGGQDWQGLAQILQSGAFRGSGIPHVANPEETYAAQLTQLQEMGFFNRQENIQALQDTGGNVQAAVDRLLSQTY